MIKTTSLALESQAESIVSSLKKGIWIYFYLLIFEGALRKWVLPELAEPLLIIRDPLALWLMVKAVQNDLWKPGSYVLVMWFLSALALILTLLVGHGNLIVAFYGLRITVIQFPMIFLIGTLFNKGDVLKIGKMMLWLSIGMTILIALQFFSPQYAWINRGIGGDAEGSGFAGALGFYRVPGTFSFTNGLALFYGLTAAYIFYFWMGEEKNFVPRNLLLAASCALILAIPLSISRTIFFEVVVSITFMLFISTKNPGVVKNLITTGLTGLLLFLAIENFSFIEPAKDAFTERFTSANRIEGGIVEGVFIDRFLGGMYGELINEDFSFWGAGLGMGTNVGGNLLAGDRGTFLLGEGEWARIIGEMGIVLGLALILLRLGLVVDLLRKAWSSLNYNNMLPWMLMSFGLFNLLQGQWAQPTSLGFGVLIGGLVIAAFKEEKEE